MTRSAGFTLIEVLVAIALVASAVTLSYRALSAVGEGTERLTARIDVVVDIDRLFARIERECLQRAPGKIRDARLHAQNIPDGTFFSLTSMLPTDEGSLRARRIEYRQEGRALYLITRDDPALKPDSPAQRDLLFDAVDLFALRFLDSNQTWQTTWDDTQEAYPRAVEVRLKVRGEEGLRVFALP